MDQKVRAEMPYTRLTVHTLNGTADGSTQFTVICLANSTFTAVSSSLHWIEYPFQPSFMRCILLRRVCSMVWSLTPCDRTELHLVKSES